MIMLFFIFTNILFFFIILSYICNFNFIYHCYHIYYFNYYYYEVLQVMVLLIIASISFIKHAISAGIRILKIS